MAQIKSILRSNFRIKDLGPLKYFLSLEVNQYDEGICVSQRKYCLELLTDSGMLGCKPSSTPMDSSMRLRQNDSSYFLDDPLSYRSLVGRLIYLTTTCLDIVYATQQLSQFMAHPTKSHLGATRRVLRYLKSCPSKGLFFKRDSHTHLIGFSDADWATCVDTRRSITGYCFFLGNSLISWKTKKQNTVSRSSSEVEYRALATSTCELQWLSYLLDDLKITCTKSAVLYCDNQSALYIAANPVFLERTKHLEIDCHLVREKSQAGLMRLLPIPSCHQLADMFTKALPPRSFTSNVSKLELVDLYTPPTCGGLTENGPKPLEETHDNLARINPVDTSNCK
ncbi:uncharacterized protein LOC114400433 [Glycine soja]|uniref:uncharacterized protein LOC114400433 n=1 Tax=Glycine soja TaxID=3848 RepID=UPI00103E20CB|nr:uncharacterized protein LOC114400433 [Glycine soja]